MTFRAPSLGDVTAARGIAAKKRATREGERDGGETEEPPQAHAAETAPATKSAITQRKPSDQQSERSRARSAI